MSRVITVENVSKRYRFQSYRPSLRQEFGQMMKRLIGQTQQVTWEEKPFWSLRNVSFSLNAGDSLGIIGPNGAGKTTLLRLLSGIIEPTEGRIEVLGKFAPLIGLGAGFDNERTGRQNIYLNAAIQGISTQRVNQVLNEIIDFTELGEFIDRPVKIYSSGMIGRLGFGIASYLAPDIVFLDEVFSVGDIGFQSKSMDRILEFRERKTTLVFISHGLDSIRKLCTRTIWLEHGQIVMDGVTDEVVSAYQTSRLAHENP